MNPLFLFTRATPALLDDSTVLFTETGRLVVANMLTGNGWQIESKSGDEGPGEFAGARPMAFALGEEIFTITMSGAYSVFSKTGSLLASGRVPLAFRPSESTEVVGIAGGRIVTTYLQQFDRHGPSEQTVRQGIRLYDLDGNVVLDVDTLAPIVMRIVGQDVSSNSWGTEIARGDLLIAKAREDYIVYKSGNRITTISPSGLTIASREMDWKVWDVRIDAAGRIWGFVRATDSITGHPGMIVLDRELNELGRLAEEFVVNGSANAMLTLKRDSLGTRQFVLLWRPDWPEVLGTRQ